MKTILSIGLILLLAGCGSNDNSAITSYMYSTPTCVQHGDNPTAILLGDSITKGMPNGIISGSYINCGMMGAESGFVLQSIDTLVSGTTYSTAYVMIGTNDARNAKASITSDVPFDTTMYSSNVSGIVSKLKAKGLTVRLHSVPPVSSDSPDTNMNTLLLSEATKSVAISEGAGFYDIRPPLEDAQGYLNSKYTYDGIHLNGDGYNAIKGVY